MNGTNAREICRWGPHQQLAGLQRPNDGLNHSLHIGGQNDNPYVRNRIYPRIISDGSGNTRNNPVLGFWKCREEIGF